MKYTKLYTLILFLLTMPFSYAGEKAGNGGVVFECGSTIQLVDAWEGQDVGYPLSLGNDPNAPLRDLVKIYLERLSFFDSEKALRFKDLSDQFISDLELLATDPHSSATVLVRFTQGNLPFSLDSDEITQPDGCTKKQAVTQRKPDIDGDRLFTISLKIWSAMTNETRALTLFHELNVRDQITHGRRDTTRPARIMNRYIASPKMANTKTMCEYFHTKMDLDFGEIKYGDLTLTNPDTATCWPTTRTMKSADVHRLSVKDGSNLFVVQIRNANFAEHSTEWVSGGGVLFKSSYSQEGIDESLFGGDPDVTIQMRSNSLIRKLEPHRFIIQDLERHHFMRGQVGHATLEFSDDGLMPAIETILP